MGFIRPSGNESVLEAPSVKSSWPPAVNARARYESEATQAAYGHGLSVDPSAPLGELVISQGVLDWTLRCANQLETLPWPRPGSWQADVDGILDLGRNSDACQVAIGVC